MLMVQYFKEQDEIRRQEDEKRRKEEVLRRQGEQERQEGRWIKLFEQSRLGGESSEHTPFVKLQQLGQGNIFQYLDK